jgi:signal peptidase II
MSATSVFSGNYLKVGYQALIVIGSVLFLDQLSKFLVHAYIPLIDHSYYLYPYGGIEVFKNFIGIEFSINYMTNKGAAWGMLGNYQLPLIILRSFLIIGTLIYLFFFNSQPSWRIPLLLIVGGAIGNVIDFFSYGYVIDMFHFVFWGYDFPVFNVADTAISIGIGALFLLSWLDR